MADNPYHFLCFFYVYLLKSRKDSKLYIGLTSDLKRRIEEHNNGQTKSTKNRRPLTHIYYEAYLDFRDAKMKELKLKKYKNSYLYGIEKKITLQLI